MYSEIFLRLEPLVGVQPRAAIRRSLPGGPLRVADARAPPLGPPGTGAALRAPPPRRCGRRRALYQESNLAPALHRAAASARAPTPPKPAPSHPPERASPARAGVAPSRC